MPCGLAVDACTHCVPNLLAGGVYKGEGDNSNKASPQNFKMAGVLPFVRGLDFSQNDFQVCIHFLITPVET